MESLNIKSDYGRYNLIVTEIETKDQGYIVIKESNNTEKLIREAMHFLNSKGCHNIYVCSDDDLNLPSLAFTEKTYRTPRFPMKADKDIKLKNLDLENRLDYVKIINSSLNKYFLNETYYNNQVLDLLNDKDYELGFFMFKKMPIGIYLMKDNQIRKFVILSQYQRLGYGTRCLSRLLNKKYNVYITITSDNERAINFFVKNGFVPDEKELKWYKL